jgi:hypothetical protein
LVFTAIGLLITGPQAVLFGVGAGAVLVIAGVTYIMDQMLMVVLMNHLLQHFLLTSTYRN